MIFAFNYVVKGNVKTIKSSTFAWPFHGDRVQNFFDFTYCTTAKYFQVNNL